MSEADESFYHEKKIMELKKTLPIAEKPAPSDAEFAQKLLQICKELHDRQLKIHAHLLQFLTSKCVFDADTEIASASGSECSYNFHLDRRQ